MRHDKTLDDKGNDPPKATPKAAHQTVRKSPYAPKAVHILLRPITSSSPTSDDPIRHVAILAPRARVELFRKAQSKSPETNQKVVSGRQVTQMSKRCSRASDQSYSNSHAQQTCSPPEILPRKDTSVMQTSSRQGLTRSEFELCRQIVTETIQRCSDSHFVNLSILLSCLLHYLRPMHHTEFPAISNLFHQQSPRRGVCTDFEQEDTGNWAQLRRPCRDLLTVDDRGYICFAIPQLCTYLKSCPIDGIDRTELTVARLCIAQVGVAFVPGRFQNSLFSDYARHSWYRHYRTVQSVGPGLATQVHQLLCETDFIASIEGAPVSSADQMGVEASRIRAEAARKFCKTHKLHVLDEMYSNYQYCTPDCHDGLGPVRQLRTACLTRTQALCRKFEDLQIREVDDTLSDWVFVSNATSD